jgi:hypothetical protein
MPGAGTLGPTHPLGRGAAFRLLCSRPGFHDNGAAVGVMLEIQTPSLLPDLSSGYGTAA